MNLLCQPGLRLFSIACPTSASLRRPAASLLRIRRRAIPCSAFSSSTSSSTTTTIMDEAALAMFQRKRALQSEVRRALRAFPYDQRSQEDIAIQKIVLDSAWFRSSTALCAYISCEALCEVDTSRILAEILNNSNADHKTQVMKKLYVPRVEDKNSHMRMLKISSTKDLVVNSMNILEPSPVNTDGSEHEDVMHANHPVDIFLLPGIAFDRHGRRLGRGGGYYDVFLRKYQEHVTEHRWKKPLLVALAYSVQIMEDNMIPMTATDVPIDAIVCASGVMPISPAALEIM